MYEVPHRDASGFSFLHSQHHKKYEMLQSRRDGHTMALRSRARTGVHTQTNWLCSVISSHCSVMTGWDYNPIGVLLMIIRTSHCTMPGRLFLMFVKSREHNISPIMGWNRTGQRYTQKTRQAQPMKNLMFTHRRSIYWILYFSILLDPCWLLKECCLNLNVTEKPRRITSEMIRTFHWVLSNIYYLGRRWNVIPDQDWPL